MKFLVASFLAIIWIAIVEAQGGTNVDLTRVRRNSAAREPYCTGGRVINYSEFLSSSFFGSHSDSQVEAQGETHNALTRGREASTGILNIFDEIFSSTKSDSLRKFGRIVKHVKPWLGAIGPVISIFQTFTDSPEIARMKDEFRNVNRQFSRVFYQLSDIETEIHRSTLNTQYHRYEQKIINLSTKMKLWQDRPDSTYYREDFKNAYEDLFEDSANFLYLGMTRDEYILNDNIPKRVMQFTKNHYRETGKFLCQMVKLITQGVNIELTYSALTQNEANQLRRKNDWEGKLQHLVCHVDQKIKEVKNRWESEFESNIDTALATNQGKSNREFGENLYNFLKDKFDWRDWIVLAYDPVRGNDAHWVSWTWIGGLRRFRTGGRNLVVASVRSSSDQIDKTSAKAILRTIETNDCYVWCISRWAKDIFRDMPRDYAARGVIEVGADVSCFGYEPRTVFIHDRYMYLYLFK